LYRRETEVDELIPNISSPPFNNAHKTIAFA